MSVHGINDDFVQHVVYEPIGEQWSQRFIQRHPHIATAMTRSIELSRITAVTPEIIENWFDVLFQTIEEYEILWKNTYNCDELGSGIGKGKRKQVVIDTEVKQSYQAEPGRQEWVAVMDCICDGWFP